MGKLGKAPPANVVSPNDTPPYIEGRLNPVSDTSRLLKQRSVGELRLEMGVDGPLVMREAGASKVRLPRGSRQAILINTSGGLAGGDHLSLDIRCTQSASLTVTSQAAERVYRTLGPPAVIQANFQAARGASLLWLPQETILFDGASLERHYDIDLAPGATFIALEPIVFGRHEMGETARAVRILDRWRIRLDGKLMHADDLRIDSSLSQSAATFAGAGAMATLIVVANDAERHIDLLRDILGDQGGASAWNGKLVARCLAGDGYGLRKLLIPMLMAVVGEKAVPRIWTM
jgi:urease accessory protein